MAIVTVSVAAGADYYTSGGGATYYAAGETVEHMWLGTGAEKLGISGDVTTEKLGALFRGFHPDGRPLVQNAGSKERQGGWELCFIVDKDLGVKLAATKDPAERALLLRCITDSVRETFAKIEREAATTRRGPGGSVREPVGLVAAAVFHHENRRGEPFPHWHVPVVNAGVRADGTTGTLWSKTFYDRQKEFGQWFTDRLIEKLTALGVRVERTGHGFRLPEVPRELADALSTRRKEILAEMKRKGVKGPKAAEVAAKATRTEKERNSTHEEVRARWRDLIESHGYRPEPLNQKAQEQSREQGNRPEEREKEKSREATPSTRTPSPAEDRSKLQPAVRDAIRAVAGRLNHFDVDDVMRTLHVLRRASNLGDGRLEDKAVRQAVRAELARGKEFVRLKGDRFTTKENLKTEEKLLRGAKKLNARKPRGVKEKLIEWATKKWVALSREEKEAVRHVTTPKKGSIRFVEAHAGTDKYAFLRTASEVWQKAGHRVVAASPTSSAADALRKETRIQTLTHYGLLAAVKGPSLAARLGHHMGQILRAAAKKPTRTPKPFIDAKTVVVVDGANTLSTKDMAKVVRAAARGGGQLVMVGDRNQLQAFRHGGAFAHLADTYGRAELKENKTQEGSRAKANAAAVRDGRAAEFLRDLEKGKRLFTAASREEAVETLVADWSRQNPVDQRRSLILTGSVRDAADVNRRCQASRRGWDRISANSVTNGAERFHEGDRVLFTRRSKVHGVEGGERGTVTAVFGPLNILTAKLDRGRTVTVPLRTFPHVKLGYAATVHQSQAATAERVFVLAGGPMEDRGLATLQASRHRDTLRVYAKDKGGPWVLKAQMERSREQTLAHQHLDQERQRKRDERSREQTHSP